MQKDKLWSQINDHEKFKEKNTGGKWGVCLNRYFYLTLFGLVWLRERFFRLRITADKLETLQTLRDHACAKVVWKRMQFNL